MFYDKELIAHKLLRWENVISNFMLPEWESIPDIGLYMEQVIVLLSQYLELISAFDGKIKDDDDEDSKVFSAAAINNYVRLKIMPAPIKKKYYRIHIAYLIMIFTLKQSVSINVLKEIIPTGLSEEDVKKIYTDYCETYHNVSLYYIDTVRRHAGSIVGGSQEDNNSVEKFVIHEALSAGFSRILTEKVVRLKGADKDDIISNEIPR